MQNEPKARVRRHTLPESVKALRPCQRQGLECLRQRCQDGKRRLPVSLPTGKTLIFAQLPHHFRMKKRLLVLTHREGLGSPAAKHHG